MGQFCAYHNPIRSHATSIHICWTFKIILLSELKTTVVIPLMATDDTTSIRLSRLDPTFEIHGANFTAMTQEMAGLDRKYLGEYVCDLSHFRSEIIGSIDFILTGV
ncbi:plasmid maintenance protein CcdB [Pseudidiomarina tainanensis]|uniref:Plasmid maintenance protein CcdB n=1 Tax=Pseudidiomarina tainanensis TaxID=502365 RepID=A0ACD2HGX2_9GAMM|nr:CcdB family protein [Pseudidiomarina tainanensis]RZQ55775.1 plasmid maintenance protein CcdB [Pseudidiomarina tainanensis]